MKMPMDVRRWFQNFSNVVPARMTHVEIYGTLAASSGATQPIEAPFSTQSIHTTRNVGLQHGNGTLMQKPLESCQERNCGDSSDPTSLCQQEFIEAYYITKCKELDKKRAAVFHESNVAFNVAKHPVFVAAVKATSMASCDYTPPMYHAMRTKHIKPKVKQVKAEIEKATK
jgi:hypothetical protein